LNFKGVKSRSEDLILSDRCVNIKLEVSSKRITRKSDIFGINNLRVKGEIIIEVQKLF